MGSTCRTTFDDIPKQWVKWLRCGNRCYKRPGYRRPKPNVVAVLRAQITDGVVLGYWSGIPLDPSVKYSDPFYPSVDHVSGRNDKKNIVIETRIVNDMKSSLSEDDFWTLISIVYMHGNKLKKTLGAKKLQEKLDPGWKPRMTYKPSKKKRRV